MTKLLITKQVIQGIHLTDLLNISHKWQQLIIVAFYLEETTDVADGSDSFVDKLVAQVVKNLKVS